HAIALDPDFALGYAGIGYICGLIYNWYGADPQLISRGMAACDRALSLERDLPEALTARAIISYDLKNYESALHDARIAVQSKPDCQGAYWIMACTLFAAGRYEEAAAMVDDALKNNADDDNIFVPFVMSFDRLGRHDQAMRLREQHVLALEKQLE